MVGRKSNPSAKEYGHFLCSLLAANFKGNISTKRFSKRSLLVGFYESQLLCSYVIFLANQRFYLINVTQCWDNHIFTKHLMNLGQDIRRRNMEPDLYVELLIVEYMCFFLILRINGWYSSTKSRNALFVF